MKTANSRRTILSLTVALAFVVASPTVQGQSAAWDATKYFKYNIEYVEFDSASRVVTVMFSVSNPQDNNSLWDIKKDLPFTRSGARIFVDFGWDTSDYTNIASRGESLKGLTVLPNFKPAAATPMAINALLLAKPVLEGALVYIVTAKLPWQAHGTGAVVIEGHPVWPVDDAGTLASVPTALKGDFSS